jgi:hypothetical protein
MSDYVDVSARPPVDRVIKAQSKTTAAETAGVRESDCVGEGDDYATGKGNGR